MTAERTETVDTAPRGAKPRARNAKPRTRDAKPETAEANARNGEVKPPRKRISLTREAILDAAMHVSSTEGGASLTFSRLGKELGADPTAVYRHFRDKDDLILALTDQLIAESMELAAQKSYEPSDWRRPLLGLAFAIRAVYLSHPAIAVLSAIRTTASPTESRSVEQIIGMLHQAGLPVVEAAECYRMLIDMTLAMVQATASWLLLDENARAKDDLAWVLKYGMLPAKEFPLLHESNTRLVELFRDDEEVFRLTLETFLDGVELRITRRVAEGRSS